MTETTETYNNTLKDVVYPGEHDPQSPLKNFHRLFALSLDGMSADVITTGEQVHGLSQHDNRRAIISAQKRLGSQLDRLQSHGEDVFQQLIQVAHATKKRGKVIYAHGGRAFENGESVWYLKDSHNNKVPARTIIAELMRESDTGYILCLACNPPRERGIVGEEIKPEEISVPVVYYTDVSRAPTNEALPSNPQIAYPLNRQV